MSHTAIIIFSLVVAIIYSATNVYICRRVLQALQVGKKTKYFIIALFVVLASSYLIARAMNNRPYNIWLSITEWTGAIWMAGMLYSFFLCLALDIIRFISKKFKLIPDKIKDNYLKSKRIIFLCAFIIITATIGFGYMNTRITYYNHQNISLNKPIKNSNHYRIAFASDIHLSPTFGAKEAQRLVDNINSQSPDIAILGGDIFGEYINFDKEMRLADILKNIKAKYGVYIAMGNHEYIGGINANFDYLKQTGHRVLRDEVIDIDSSLSFIFRDDLSKERFIGSERASLPSLIAKADASKPIILVDHQPFNLDSAKNLGVSLMLSGHTHNGQLFPLNWITRAIYENNWGRLQKGDFISLVSCGFGGWGPPIKTSGRSEILIIDLYGSSNGKCANQ